MNNKRNSLLCPNCRKLISGSADTCPYCGLTRPTAKWKSGMFSLLAGSGQQLVQTLIIVNVVFFIVSILINPRPDTFNFSPFQFLSPSNQSLLILGSTGTVPVFQLHRWWTLIAANFLHGGLLHILFNMLALRQLAPLVVNEYGLARTVIIYLVGGTIGFFISTMAGIAFTIGASASICSLIGALLYYGKSRGGVYGQALFSQIGGWALGIAVFGFMMPGINNWGHGGGMLAGALLGFLLGYQEKARENFNHRLLAGLCVGVTVLALLWSLVNGVLFLMVR
jgi:rhomboid protease GluP